MMNLWQSRASITGFIGLSGTRPSDVKSPYKLVGHGSSLEYAGTNEYYQADDKRNHPEEGDILTHNKQGNIRQYSNAYIDQQVNHGVGYISDQGEHEISYEQADYDERQDIVHHDAEATDIVGGYHQKQADGHCEESHDPRCGIFPLEEIQYIDLKDNDPHGKEQAVVLAAEAFEEKVQCQSHYYSAQDYK